MKNWKKAVIPLSSTVRDAVESLTESMAQIALVANADMKLLGVITDGDIRRGLLAGKTLESPAQDIMETNFLPQEAPRPATLLETMREKNSDRFLFLTAKGTSSV